MLPSGFLVFLFNISILNLTFLCLQQKGAMGPFWKSSEAQGPFPEQNERHDIKYTKLQKKLIILAYFSVFIPLYTSEPQSTIQALEMLL